MEGRAQKEINWTLLLFVAPCHSPELYEHSAVNSREGLCRVGLVGVK